MKFFAKIMLSVIGFALLNADFPTRAMTIMFHAVGFSAIFTSGALIALGRVEKNCRNMGIDIRKIGGGW